MNSQLEDVIWISVSSITSLVRNFSRWLCHERVKKQSCNGNVFVFVAVFTGIANRAIRPMLGIEDLLHTLHMPERLTANSGYDVLWYEMYEMIDSQRGA